MSKKTPTSTARRSFSASLAAAAFGGVAMAQVKQPPAARWEPTHHDKDDWLDQIPGKHRMVFDSITPDTLGDSVLFAGNFIKVNKSDYGLESSELALLVVMRHLSTPFGFNDAMWTKYGTAMAKQAGFEDPKTKAAPKTNLFNSGGYGTQLHNYGTTLDSLAKQGVQFGVCSMAGHKLAGDIATAVNGNADAIFTELTGNLIASARMVPAGILIVNRAQERGYALA
jgi:intracellular sulfur oxidation DsrE/DsrF family protein